MKVFPPLVSTSFASQQRPQPRSSHIVFMVVQSWNEYSALKEMLFSLSELESPKARTQLMALKKFQTRTGGRNMGSLSKACSASVRT